jgi:hypothetical protein
MYMIFDALPADVKDQVEGCGDSIHHGRKSKKIPRHQLTDQPETRL